MADSPVLPARVVCPGCRRDCVVNRNGYLRFHGYRIGADGGGCKGVQARVSYRYRVIDSTIDNVRVGSHLIYRNYRGETDQQEVLFNFTPQGGWYMEFMDTGLCYNGRWYDFEGNCEADASVTHP